MPDTGLIRPGPSDFGSQVAHQLSVPQIYAQALHLQGRVYLDLRHDMQAAREYWAQADSAEELIAGRQDTDEARVRYLEAIPTQYDEQIEVAAAKALAHKGPGLATILAAIEAARGAAILAHVLPGGTARLRDLPAPTDSPACWRWCTAIASAPAAQSGRLVAASHTKSPLSCAAGRGSAALGDRQCRS